MQFGIKESYCSAIMAAATIVLLSILIHLFANTLTLQNSTKDYYVAAVVEYSGTQDPKLNASENAKKNAEKHRDIIERATSTNLTLDIIVFPELGLLNYNKSLYIEVPDPRNKIIPANNDSCHEVLQIISQAAISNSVYVVVNLHELYKNGTKEYKYNTNVVFDRKGEVIARYRKYNLFGERYLNRPETPEYVTFDTDFGVTFGTFICFDIVFEEPAMGLINEQKVTDVVYPTAWFSELPFHIGVQEQSSWAYATNVNLLASGYNNMSSGNTGSGIYAGRNGPVVYLQAESDGTRILIGKVYKKSTAAKPHKKEKGEIVDFDEVIKPNLPPILHENLEPLKTSLIRPESMTTDNSQQMQVTDNIKGLQKEFILNEKLCDDKFCCNFDLNFTATFYQSNYSFINDETYNKSDGFYHYRFRLIAFDGIRTYFVGNTSGQQLCAIMPCLNDSLNSCAQPNRGNHTPSVSIKDETLGELILYSTIFNKINISGDFHNQRVLYLPSIIVSSSKESNNTFGQIYDLNNLQFEVNNNTDMAHVSLVLEKENFASGGILARLFERDNRHEQPNSGNVHVESFLNYLLCLLAILYLFSLNSH